MGSHGPCHQAVTIRRLRHPLWGEVRHVSVSTNTGPPRPGAREHSGRFTRREVLGMLLGCRAWGEAAAQVPPTGSSPAGDDQLAAARWPHWRGPAGDGQMPHWPAPLVWGPTRGVAWQAAVPPGASTPVVWDRGIYLTAQQGSQLLLLQLDLLTGKPQWVQKLGAAPAWPPQANPPSGWPWPQGSWASPCPAVDGEVVVALYAHGLLCVHQAQDGKQRWFRQLSRGKLPVRPSLASPLLWQDRVIVLFWDASSNASVPRGHLAAYQKHTGRELWQVRLPALRSQQPVLLGTSPAWGTLSDQPVIAVASAGRVYLFSPTNGQQLLDYRLGTARDSVASPLVAEQLVVVCRSTQGPLLALEHYPGRKDHRLRRLWQRQIAPVVWATPARWRDLLFLVSQKGQARCVHLPTGKTYWRRPLGGTFYASPVTADGRVYFLSYEGTCYVAAASGNYRLLARNRLPDRFIASPAVAAAHLFLRGQKRLYCVGPYLDQNR